jgi:hypothetical protein
MSNAEIIKSLVTATAKREYTATADKYLYAKDHLEAAIDDYVSEEMIDALETLLEQ